MYRVLLIDDDREVLELNQKYFEKNGLRVQICSDAAKAVELVNEFEPECILLDVMMPQKNGFLLCKEIRKTTDVPILFLSGRVSEEDKIKGFQCGADDYIEKPYSLKEVFVRIVVNIKRNQRLAENSGSIIQIQPLTIDREKRKVFYLEQEVPLSKNEYDVMYYMAKRPNEEITFEEIGKTIWGGYTQEDRQAVMVSVSRLRKKLSDYTGLDNLIQTVWSKGYKLVVKM